MSIYLNPLIETILFRLLWFNTFSCVYFVCGSWEHMAIHVYCMFYFLFYVLCVVFEISFFSFS